MVPDKFNMVDMEGIDILFSYGDIIPGLYQKLVESIAQCRYQCLYNWYFDGVLIPPTYVEMTVNHDTNDVWINDGVFVTNSDRLLAHLPSIETVLGSVVNITDALQRPVEELICYINPVQAGSGDPSPDNVRPISGWTGANIYNEETYDASATPKLTIIWETEPGTIYGGTVTLNEDGSADVVVDHGIHNGSTLSGYPYRNRSGFIIMPAMKLGNGGARGVCSILPIQTRPGANDHSDDPIALQYGWDDNRVFLWKIGNLVASATGVDTPTKAQIETFLSEHNFAFTYPLDTPQTYHFDNVGQLYTRLGTNAIWHDDNGDISVSYWKK